MVNAIVGWREWTDRQADERAESGVCRVQSFRWKLQFTVSRRFSLQSALSYGLVEVSTKRPIPMEAPWTTAEISRAAHLPRQLLRRRHARFLQPRSVGNEDNYRARTNCVKSVKQSPFHCKDSLPQLVRHCLCLPAFHCRASLGRAGGPTRTALFCTEELSPFGFHCTLLWSPSV